MDPEQEFRLTVLRELAALRREVRELRGLLQSAPAMGEAPSPPVPPTAETPRFDLEGLPESLTRRLRPILEGKAPQDARQRARWLLELCENTEDFLRYEGEDYPQAGHFLATLQKTEEEFGLQRISPQEGEEVDPRWHLVLQTIPNADRRDQVARCVRPGYTYEGDILRRAEVVAFL